MTRWEHQEVLEAVQTRLAENPDAICTRRETVEHLFGTMALCVLTCNLTRVLKRRRIEQTRPR
jgi:hypothetical protein